MSYRDDFNNYTDDTTHGKAPVLVLRTHRGPKKSLHMDPQDCQPSPPQVPDKGKPRGQVLRFKIKQNNSGKTGNGSASQLPQNLNMGDILTTGP